jgi:hypothetical protein
MVRMRTSDFSQALAALVANGRMVICRRLSPGSLALTRFRLPLSIGSRGMGNGKQRFQCSRPEHSGNDVCDATLQMPQT